MDKAEAMITAGLDQDRAEADTYYGNISETERGEIALWLTGRRGDIADAPDWVKQAVVFFASVSFMEAGLRWSQR